ncbi:hypothetical protein V0288_04840 [Pannus brasiliensis CCIBt3594]|uniref:Uncharacterized protein n=1 Tax=Pannus brasiliensis CCIBt3594 TaxID=1427578 RepID=A0AAW9QQE8_9CHRO
MSIISRKIRSIASSMFKSITALTLFASVAVVDVARAGTTAINLPVAVQRGESYQGLLARASKLAGETIGQRFQQNTAIDRVNVLVTAENQGEIAPLLSVNVSRQDWNGNPNVQRWARVFPFGKDLLGFGGSSSSPSSPPPPPSATTGAAASPPSPPAKTPPGNTPPAKTPPGDTPPDATNAPIIPPFPNDTLTEPSPPRPLPDQRLNPRTDTVP